jgi:hypothetical protein
LRGNTIGVAVALFSECTKEGVVAWRRSGDEGPLCLRERSVGEKTRVGWVNVAVGITVRVVDKHGVG